MNYYGAIFVAEDLGIRKRGYQLMTHPGNARRRF